MAWDDEGGLLDSTDPMRPIIPPPTTTRTWWRLGVGILAGLVVLIGGLAVLGRVIEPSDDPPRDPDVEHEVSLDLAVAVAPTTGLHDGATVLVSADFLAPSTVAVVQVCRDAPQRSSVWVDADCFPSTEVGYLVPATGPFEAAYQVPRTPGLEPDRLDCAERARSCLLLVGGPDATTSGFAPLTFLDGPPPGPVDTDAATYGGPKPPRSLVATGTPTGPFRSPTDVTVTVGGFLPGEPLVLGRCSADLDRTDGGLFDIAGTCEPVDEATGDHLFEGDLSTVADHAGPDGTVTVTIEARPTIVPYLLGDDRSMDLSVLLPEVTEVPATAEGHVRCTSGPGACRLVVAAAADTTRAGVVPYTITAR